MNKLIRIGVLLLLGIASILTVRNEVSASAAPPEPTILASACCVNPLCPPYCKPDAQSVKARIGTNQSKNTITSVKK